MPPEDLKLIIGGLAYSGWTEATINRSVEALAGNFSLSMIDVWGDEAVEFSPNTPCQIMVGDDKLIDGFLDDQELTDESSSNIINVTGRCKTGDLVDCSADNSPGTWKNISLLRVATDLATPYGIKVISDTDLGDKIEKVVINPGESPFEIISRLCQDKGIVPLGTVDGDLLLTTIGRNPAEDKVIRGMNFFSFKGKNDFKKRFSHIKVKGQKTNKGSSWGNNITNAVFAEAFDENIERNRVKVITADNQITNTGAQKRANWEIQVRAGRSTSIKVKGLNWRQSNGDLWSENLTAYVKNNKLRVDGEMLVRGVEYKLSATTQQITLDLVDPDIYKPEPPKRIKKKAKNNKSVWLG